MIVSDFLETIGWRFSCYTLEWSNNGYTEGVSFSYGISLRFPTVGDVLEEVNKAAVSLYIKGSLQWRTYGRSFLGCMRSLRVNVDKHLSADKREHVLEQIDKIIDDYVVWELHNV